MSSEICTAETDRPGRYQIREKLFAFGRNFKIKDNTGRHRYTVRSKKWSLRTKLLFEDSNGNVILKIHRKGIHFLDQFSILSRQDNDTDQEIATIRQKLTFFKHSYLIYSSYGEYKMKGLDIFDHSFTLANKNGKTIAIINKKFFSTADTYGVEVINSNNDQDQEDHAFILALIVILHCSIYCS